jgi:hypothetical protein
MMLMDFTSVNYGKCTRVRKTDLIYSPSFYRIGSLILTEAVNFPRFQYPICKVRNWAKTLALI